MPSRQVVLHDVSATAGEHKSTSYFLLYTPGQQDERKFDLAWLRKVAREEKNKKLVVYCEKVWSDADWKRGTSVTFGGRNEQVADLDRLLPKYHDYARRNKLSQTRIGILMARRITSHLTTKRTSDRRAGVAQLGRQVLAELRRRVGNPGT